MTEHHHFPCTTCGADMRYEPEQDQLYCVHCGASEAVAPANAGAHDALAEQDFYKAIKAAPDAITEELRVVQCQNCAAAVEFDANDQAKECPFCASPLVAAPSTQRQIKPAGVLPFLMGERKAKAQMQNWLGKLWFAPNGLSEFAQKGRPLQGIYLPYWTFDADTQTNYRGLRGTVHQRSRGNGETETEIRWRNVSGRVKRWFDDILVPGANTLPTDQDSALAHWDLSMLEPYQPEFLAGYRAEAYSIELKDAYQDARQVMNRRIERDIKFDIGGDRQRITEAHTQIKDVTYKHVLLPVWLAAYRFRGKSYVCVINGRTGQVSGERPYSTWKIALAVLAGAVVVAAIAAFVATQ